ncbi:pantoate--beta-alanine ligase [Salisediminibacterium selenitireducens]|uniref:Pantothenate synthetase n=1 Tax=Bacillus selenitireducens (strain ATCC 700615 / DSM 15326 / MLS10) TaxID=439292 RepID=D6XUW9_BACIE|nr:pantoate--beta-alanine ligase [Salisediminibacterium selenitireducens]ADH99605.1 pantoate/beta-alanine ligase [[Bacillus] selenitireducens MLS10]
MRVITEVQKMKFEIETQKKRNRSIGFVPTMGYLHDGHLSLVSACKKTADVTVMSIFVNPLQFGPGEDFDSYPRDAKRDIKIAEENGVDIVFMPDGNEMYPSPMGSKIIVHEGADVLCGASRPGHFDGVATVVMKLLQIVKPDYAAFGMKDAQQVAVIERLVQNYHLDVSIIRGNIVREEDGLAMSSRNVRLTEEERTEAPAIYQILKETARKIRNQTIVMPEEAESLAKEKLKTVISAELEYVECRSFPNLSKEDDFASGEWLLAAAVRYSQVRLIDNILIQKGDL